MAHDDEPITMSDESSTDAQHVVEFRDDGWAIQHPDACRPNLLDCVIHDAVAHEMSAYSGPGSPYLVGRYVVTLDADSRQAKYRGPLDDDKKADIKVGEVGGIPVMQHAPSSSVDDAELIASERPPLSDDPASGSRGARARGTSFSSDDASPRLHPDDAAELRQIRRDFIEALTPFHGTGPTSDRFIALWRTPDQVADLLLGLLKRLYAESPEYRSPEVASDSASPVPSSAIESVIGWARQVVAWDWSENDEECVSDMDNLRRALQHYDYHRLADGTSRDRDI